MGRSRRTVAAGAQWGVLRAGDSSGWWFWMLEMVERARDASLGQQTGRPLIERRNASGAHRHAHALFFAHRACSRSARSCLTTAPHHPRADLLGGISFGAEHATTACAEVVRRV